MALSEAERKRRYRNRLKEEAKRAPDVVLEVTEGDQISFSDFLLGKKEVRIDVFGESKYLYIDGKEQELSFIDETLDSFGSQMPDLTVDKDPEWRPEWSVENKGSLGRAERMVDGWIECAKALSELINQFKVERVNKALEILSASDMSDPERRKQVLAKIVKLEKVKERLQKEVRHSFRVTSVKGE